MSRHRYSRNAGRVDPEKLPKGPSGRALCRWCATEVPKRRKTFCSAICVHEHRVRSSASYVRECLDERDHGVCALCGLNTVAEIRILWALRPTGDSLLGSVPRHMGERAVLRAVCGNTKPGRDRRPWGIWAEQFRIRLGVFPWERRRQRFWDADHIQPVDEGGGTCGLDNYQTLCLLCHKKKTAEQKQRSAVKRTTQQKEDQDG